MSELIQLMLAAIPLAIATDWLARKIDGPRWLWIVLSLVPGLGFMVMPFLLVRAAGDIADRIARIENKLAQPPPPRRQYLLHSERNAWRIPGNEPSS